MPETLVEDRQQAASSTQAPGGVTPAVLAWRQYRLERKMFWRNPSAAFFNFVLPLLFLAAGGAILSGNEHDLSKQGPSIGGMRVMSTTFAAGAYNIVFRRERCVLNCFRDT